MKRAIEIIFILLVSFTFFISCNDDETLPEEDILTTGLIELPLGELVGFSDSDLKLTYTKLEEDSRCPFNALCIWEGRAWVKINEGIGGEGSPFNLVTENSSNLDSFVMDTINEYVIELIDVFPDPTLQGSRTDSVVVIKVEMQ